MNHSDEKENIFSEFPPVPTREWIQQITEDLKGSSFEKLIWETADKLNIRPFYRKEDLAELKSTERNPDISSLIRNLTKYPDKWEIREDIDVTGMQQANEKALNALNRGASSFCFNIPEDMPLNKEDFDSLLKGIFTDCINLNFDAPGKEQNILNFLQTKVSESKTEPARINGSVNNDPLGILAVRGNFIRTEKKDMDLSGDLIFKYSGIFPNVRLTGLNGHIFHNAGASPAQELALSLACASEYMEHFTGMGLTPEQSAGSFQLNMATGPHFFMEIAKIRAARVLFHRMISAWKPVKNYPCRIFIHAVTSEWNHTIFDPYVNMLRGTTEAMSAALGGADSITIIPFDKSFRKTSSLSERIARNTQIILKEEAYLNKVLDPSSGSYYIEKITSSLAEKAWEIFLDLETRGGFSGSLKSGYIQIMLKEAARRRNMDIATRREILLGTNQYPDLQEKLPEDISSLVPVKNTPPPEDLMAEPLMKYRGAMAFEELRISVMKNKKGRPVVFLIPVGNVNQRIARSAFSSNFFGCAGYKVIENIAFDSVGEGVAAALKAKVSIVVLCSSDDQYAVIAPEANELIRNKALLVIAGYPKDNMEELKSKGIEHFIHIRSNILEELKRFNELLNVE